ncbi:MAG TPA: type II toxin-antitoxin system VapC family toxin [Rhodanobacteraceae bacterium]
MRFYLDTSVALHAVLPGGDRRARAWLQALDGGDDDICASTLLRLEMIRALRRERLDTAWAQLVLQRLDLISIDDGVLRFAAAIESHVKSLDAIHLATCSLLGNAVTMVTHDANMADVAGSLGFAVHDPLAMEALRHE